MEQDKENIRFLKKSDLLEVAKKIKESEKEFNLSKKRKETLRLLSDYFGDTESDRDWKKE